jgi:hypothetical protein
VRQLSRNLNNQEVLDKTRKKVLKQSQSLPKFSFNGNFALPQGSLNREEDGDSKVVGDAADLDLVNDDEFVQHHNRSRSQVEPPSADVTSSAAAPAVVKKGRKPLSLQLDDSDMSGEPQSGSVLVSEQRHVGGVGKGNNALQLDSFYEAVPPNPFENEHIEVAGHKPSASSPSHASHVSPRGTLHVGRLKIMEGGMALADDAASDKSGSSFSRHGFGSGPHASSNSTNSSSYSGNSNHNNSRFGPIGSSFRAGSKRGVARTAPLSGGKKDFLEVGTLGSGASGVVSEAVHLPTMTLVALKMLPIYNQQKRQHVARELAVLYRNLAELRLVDGRLGPPGDGSAAAAAVDSKRVDKDEDAVDVAAGLVGSSRCPNVLSLYNAFVDPKTGMINLVIEYMDGGSLDDLVQQGGCSDEVVLADIAAQTIAGLLFLHQHKHVHRDIKPANILCSSSGLIKIADFGISKALDKTTGFANSFVGTVCYMSPERITGENYSFSSDVWSLGLTLLAVALGRFPLSMVVEEPAQDKDGGDGGPNGQGTKKKKKTVPIGGGPGGYWAMIKV